MTEPQQPTPEEIAAATQVSTAAAEALAANTNDPEAARAAATAAVQEKAAETQLKLSEDDCKAIVDQMIERMDALGAFAPPPAADAPPPPPPAAAVTDPATEEPAPPAEPPRKRTFAERFAGQ